MDKDAGIKLMESSQTEREWNDNCDKVKASHGGDYPSWWFSTVVMSGILARTAAKWGSDGKIKVVEVKPGENVFG
jgi:hypothetical protein